MGTQRVAVVTDSTAYLPKEVQERLNITVIPLNVLWGEEVLKDGVDIMPSEFYERLQSAKLMPKTSQPSAGEFVDLFQAVAEKYNVDTIVAILISSKLSGTISSAEAAREMLSGINVEVVDSLSTSMGLGFQAMVAAEAAQAGAAAREVAEAARDLVYRIQLLFVVDTLEFLHRGGRIGGATRLLGTVLSLKPILELEGGKIESLDKVRTKKKAVERLLDVALERRGASNIPRAAVLHANVPGEGAALLDEFASRLDPRELYLTEISPVIGTHTGPGALGAIFYT